MAKQHPKKRALFRDKLGLDLRKKLV